MRVPLLDLQAQYATIRDEIRPVIERVIESQQFILGAEVEAFEQEIAAYCGAKYAVGVSSGTDALLLALMAAGIGEGDEVITTPYSFIATATAISRVGAIPVFVDIDPVTYNMDPAAIEDEITNSTKAIIPVHLFGQCANMKPILDLAKQYKILVIEDAAQAIGAECVVSGKKPVKAGMMGDFGCFSFFPSKNLGGFGDGGLVTTNDEALATRVKQLRQHGGADKYRNTMIGINGRLDALQAAVLRVKLAHLDSWSAARREHADDYTKALQHVAGVQTPVTAAGNVHIYNQYSLRVQKRDELQAALNQQEIGNAIYYPIPLHLQECYRELKYQEGDFPAAEQAAKEAIALPVYPELTKAQQDHVIETIQAFYR